MWAYTSEHSGDGLFDVPSTNPNRGPETPVPVDGSDASTSRSPIFLSPLYECLETNIPRSLMRYAEMDFNERIQLFPNHNDVQQYLEHYAEDVRDVVRFSTQVTEVSFCEDNDAADSPTEARRWAVEAIHLPTGSTNIDTYDAVVVGSGHFSVPYIPDIPGIVEWNVAFPGSISHSKYYRVPGNFSGRKVVVVGNSASGLDISSQIASVCKSPLLVSSKSQSYLAPGFKTNNNVQEVPKITQFEVLSHSIHFEDGSIVRGVDDILFCTGYLYSMPFLKNLKPHPIGDGTRVLNTYQHLFFSPIPTLAFLTLPQKIIPFPIAEVQAAVVARVYAGRLALPRKEDMTSWEARVVEERGTGGDFHTLPFPKDAEYINMLYDWALSAEPRNGLENNGQGKLGKRWGKWQYWARERFPAIRRAFVEKGEDRKNITTLEEVGFHFDEWKRNQRKVDSGQPSDHYLEGEKGAL